MIYNIGLSSVATGTADVITATFSPAITLSDRRIVFLRVATPNTTTTPTFNPNSLGAQVVKGKAGATLKIGELTGDCILMYHTTGTFWEVLNSTPFLDATSSIQTQFANITNGNVSFKRISGYWYSSAITSFQASTASLAKDVIRLTPFIVSESESFDRIAMEISGAGTAGSLVRLGIYNSSGGYPTTNLLNAGTIAGDSATNQTITILQALTPGVYWLAYIHNSVANISFRTIQATTGAIPSILGLKDGDFSGNQLNVIQMSYTYDGTLPTISGATMSGLNVAIVSLRKV